MPIGVSPGNRKLCLSYDSNTILQHGTVCVHQQSDTWAPHPRERPGAHIEVGQPGAGHSDLPVSGVLEAGGRLVMQATDPCLRSLGRLLCILTTYGLG
jgi:hypothetical protein